MEPISDFSPEMDAILAAMWPNHTMNELSTALAISRDRVRTRARQMGLPKPSRAVLFAPSKLEWVTIATQKAREARVRPSDVMAGCGYRAAVYARWQAWRAVKALNPRYTLAGVARTSGFDHSTLVSAFRRLDGAATRKHVASDAETQ